MPHPAVRPRSSVARWRSALAAILVAGLAVVAATVGIAAPAAAKTAFPSVQASVGCSTDDDGAGALQFSALLVGDEYAWTVTGEGYSVGGSFVALTEEPEVALEGLAPGLYSINVALGGESLELWGQFTVEACPPDLDVSVTPVQCSTGDDGEALLTLTGLVPGGLYTYSVEGPNFSVGGLLDEVGETEDIELIGMPPGNYVAYAEQVVPQQEAGAGAVPDPPNFDWVGFAIEPCQPEIGVEVTECAASGGTGATVVALSKLVAGVEYKVWVTDPGDTDGTPYGEVLAVTGAAIGTATVEVSSLPAHEYTVWVEGVWVAEPWEEPPYVGGGNFTPLESVVLAANGDFTLAPCPGAPVKPAVTPAKVLPATGPESAGPLALGSALLLGLGVVALLAAGRRRRMLVS